VNISDVTAALTKVSQLVGDVPVVLRDLETDAETELKSLEVSIDAATGQTSSIVTVTHGPPAPAPALEPDVLTLPAAEASAPPAG
jgi:hypothetical protein